MNRLALALGLVAALALPSVTSAATGLHPVRGERAIERQLHGYVASDCRTIGPRSIACTVVGPWEEEEPEAPTSVTVTAVARLSHGRIYVTVVGFEGQTSERAISATRRRPRPTTSGP